MQQRPRISIRRSVDRAAQRPPHAPVRQSNYSEKTGVRPTPQPPRLPPPPAATSSQTPSSPPQPDRTNPLCRSNLPSSPPDSQCPACPPTSADPLSPLTSPSIRLTRHGHSP